MQAGDRLVAVTGESVEGLGHEETVSRIRAQGSCVSLIVVDPKTDRFFSMVRAEGGGAGVWAGIEQGSGGGRCYRSVLPTSFQVRLSPLLFLESTEAPASPQETCSASLVETKDLPVEDTAMPLDPGGSRQCSLYPGPGGGYGFRLSCVAGEPRIFISQVTYGP